MTLRAGEGTAVDVTANDSDPDGEQLQVCRVGPSPGASGDDGAGRELLVLAEPSRHGTYTLTYYACDVSYLTAGTADGQGQAAAPTLDIVPVGDGPPGGSGSSTPTRTRPSAAPGGPLDSDKRRGQR